MAKKTRQNERLRLQPSIIEAAVGGDVDAINQTVHHYQGYINALATQRLFDESGQIHLCVNEQLKKHLETKLITAILQFKIKK